MKSGRVYVLVALTLSSASVRSDYPPPSEDVHGYYTQSRGSSGGLAGTGRVTAGFGGGYVGGHPDWHSGSDWMDGTHGMVGLSHARCVDIPDNLTLCRNIGYRQMMLPNLLEHDSLREVGQQASSWVRLVAVRCHPDTQVFLCSLFAPVCLDRPVWPCRSLCEAVKAGCVDRMLKYGFPWPEMLRCDQFPSDNALCIGLRAADSHGDEVSCPACSQQQSYDVIIDNYCTADFAMRIRVDQAIVSGNDLKIVANRRRKIYKTSAAVKRRDLRRSPLYVDNGANCDCASLEQTQNVDGSSSSQHDSFLVTGRKRGDRLVVESIQPFSRRSKDLRRAVRAIRQSDVCEGQSVVADLGRSRVEGGRSGGQQTRRRPRKHRGEASTMETTTTTTTATTQAPARNGGRSRNRQTTSRRNRGRNRGARQRARASRRDRDHQGRH